MVVVRGIRPLMDEFADLEPVSSQIAIDIGSHAAGFSTNDYTVTGMLGKPDASRRDAGIYSSRVHWLKQQLIVLLFIQSNSISIQEAMRVLTGSLHKIIKLLHPPL